MQRTLGWIWSSRRETIGERGRNQPTNQKPEPSAKQPITNTLSTNSCKILFSTLDIFISKEKEEKIRESWIENLGTGSAATGGGEGMNGWMDGSTINWSADDTLIHFRQIKGEWFILSCAFFVTNMFSIFFLDIYFNIPLNV